MDNNTIIAMTTDFVKKELEGIESGHDWWHIYRVWKLAKSIAKDENVDLFIVELGALLHDIGDSKFYDGNEEVGPAKARDFLFSLKVEEEIMQHIENIIRNISFKGGNLEQTFTSPELDVIQDADRLDAMGAIGIARTFNYGGHKGRAIYNPEIPPQPGQSKEQYKKSTAPTINHFYEKLLLLKDRMNTQTGKRMAFHRHQVMEDFLKEFFREWEGDSNHQWAVGSEQ